MELQSLAHHATEKEFKMKYMLPAVALIAVGISAPLSAQAMQNMQGMDHGKMDHGKMGNGAMMKDTPANPYATTSMSMMQKMMAAMGSDAGETWTRKMIEHHRGAIGMSRIALDKAKAPETRAMAQKTIDEQEKDIAELQASLKRMGKSAQ